MRTSTALSLSLPLLALALAAAPQARADDGHACRHSAAQALDLEVGDAARVEFIVGPHTLRLDGRPGPGEGSGTVDHSGVRGRTDLPRRR